MLLLTSLLNSNIVKRIHWRSLAEAGKCLFNWEMTGSNLRWCILVEIIQYSSCFQAESMHWIVMRPTPIADHIGQQSFRHIWRQLLSAGNALSLEQPTWEAFLSFRQCVYGSLIDIFNIVTAILVQHVDSSYNPSDFCSWRTLSRHRLSWLRLFVVILSSSRHVTSW
jgi:hypothetical protein